MSGCGSPGGLLTELSARLFALSDFFVEFLPHLLKSQQLTCLAQR